jgi:sugar/nucleoside kinase (ribokinase family)
MWPSYQRATSLTAILGGMARRSNASVDPGARKTPERRPGVDPGNAERPAAEDVVGAPSPPRRAARIAGRLRPGAIVGRRSRRPSVVVLGDLMLDAVLKPSHPMVRGTDVPGHVMLRQGGSAANVGRWLGRLGVRVQLICAVGRDGVGRALVDTLERDGVVVRAARVRRLPTGRIGVVVSPGSETVGSAERSFVADRGAADALTRADVRSAWFRGVDVLHLPAYSLLGEPLGSAGRWAAQLARMNGAAVSVDLASSGPLLAGGQTAAQALLRSVAPDVLFATASEAEALLGGWALEGLLAFAPVVVIKRGAQGASILARGEGSTPIRSDIATRPVSAADTTGAGDAFDAGFLAAWLEGRATGQPATDSLRRATLAGHRVAARHLGRPPLELDIR